MSIKFFVLTCLYRRPEITEICFRGIKRLQEEFDIDALAVYSEGEKPLCDKWGIRSTEYENQPLGAKWNAGLAEALRYDWDYLVTLGSDDLIANEYLRQEFGEAGGLNRCGIWDVRTGAKAIFDNNYCLGIGRVIRRDTIESLGHQVKLKFHQSMIGPDVHVVAKRPEVYSKRYAERFARHADVVEERTVTPQLWDGTFSKGLDFTSNILLLRNGIRQNIHLSDKILAIDLKSDENIWNIEQYPAKDWEVDWLSEDEENAIRRLKQTRND